MAGWVSPTGCNDPDNLWSNEANTYDEDTGTYAQQYITGWSAVLEPTLTSPIQCDKIRFYVGYVAAMTQVSIRVYDGASWTDVYTGVFTANQWEEKTFTQQAVEKAEFKGFTTSAEYARLYEFDFNEVAVTFIPRVMII